MSQDAAELGCSRATMQQSQDHENLGIGHDGPQIQGLAMIPKQFQPQAQDPALHAWTLKMLTLGLNAMIF